MLMTLSIEPQVSPWNSRVSSSGDALQNSDWALTNFAELVHAISLF
jgi:hypothetical protein